NISLLTITLLIFGIVAIVRGRKKRARGWLIAGILSLAVSLFFGFVIVSALLRGFSRGWAEERNRSGLNARLWAKAGTVTGETLPFTLERPAGWALNRKQAPYEVMVSSSDEYVGVIADYGDFGGSEFLAELARQQIESVAAEVQFTDNEPITIDA